MEHIYTSVVILQSEDLYDLQEKDTFKYRMTAGELEWLAFIDGKYSIADYINDNLENDILSIDTWDMSLALEDDNMQPKAVMLSDDTALQKIFFWCYSETSQEDEDEYITQK